MQSDGIYRAVKYKVGSIARYGGIFDIVCMAPRILNVGAGWKW